MASLLPQQQRWRQRKTLRLGQKALIPRSKAALNLPLSECVVEHVVPKMVIVNRLMDMKPLTTRAITELLASHFMVVLVTHGEHRRLNASGLRSQMPREWDGLDILARYAAVGIKLQAKQRNTQALAEALNRRTG